LGKNNANDSSFLNFTPGATTADNYFSVSHGTLNPSFCVRYNGTVGIGITNPTNNLHVLSSTSAFDGTTTGSHRLFVAKNTSTDVASVIFTQGGTSTAQGVFEVGLTGTSNLYFNGGPNIGQYTTRMTIAAANGNVGIGTTTPGALLDVWNGSIRSYCSVNGAPTSGLSVTNASSGSSAYAYINLTTDTGSAGFFKNSSTRTADGPAKCATLRNDDGDLRLAAAGTSPYIFLQSSTSNVGINTTTPQRTLHLYGTARFENLGTVTATKYIVTDASGNIGSQAGLISDARLKSAVADIEDGLSKIMALRPVSFNWKDADVGGPDREIGFIAQEVQEVVPEVVRFENDLFCVKYENMTAVLTKAIQELTARLQIAEQEIALLKAR
jgi:hypothetical protein